MELGNSPFRKRRSTRNKSGQPVKWWYPQGEKNDLCFVGIFSVRIDNVSCPCGIHEHSPCSHNSAEESHSNPRYSILLAPTPTNTANDTEDNTGDRTEKAKLGFVDTVVATGEKTGHPSHNWFTDYCR